MLTYHHPEYVARAADALAKQVGAPPYDVWLVNNGGCAKTDAIAAAAGWRCINPGYNTGYAEGHNLAARLSHQDAAGYLLQMNDDLIPEPGFLRAFWDGRDEADIIGGLQLDPDGRVNHAGGYIDGVPWPRHTGRFEPRALWEGRGVEGRAWVTGAALLVQRALFDGLGGLDEVYFYGCEDYDFCARAIEAGCRIGVNLNAVSIHGELGTRTGGEADRANEAIMRERWQAKFHALADAAHGRWMI